MLAIDAAEPLIASKLAPTEEGISRDCFCGRPRLLPRAGGVRPIPVDCPAGALLASGFVDRPAIASKQCFFAVDADDLIGIGDRVVASLPRFIHTLVRSTRATACNEDPAQPAG
ncbi:hypothetical protein [Pseudomonas lopnurensis]|uniref:hypothetical protein n=1 Tax=Pseudomonas lopnurensis TaxID=1477517 RepID=UPI00187AA048|nr:hypothetical protein [Pseudomonas lopnurensis]MBE7376337.1 hypothetical protein [Pseudomonas lopnurensis]